MKDNNNPIQIFDRDAVMRNHARAEEQFSEYDFLFQWAAENLRERLEVIQRDFDHIVQIGARGPDLGTKVELQGEIEQLPALDVPADMIVSNLALHAVNDLPGVLLQIRNALKSDGLFLAAMFGGETLHELRESLTITEIAIHGGASPRVFPFADKQQLGALLQRAGFALPVVDSEIVTVTYDNLFKLIGDLRGMGEGNAIAARSKNYVGKRFFMEAAKHYHENHAEDDGRIVASFEVIFLLGWAPHDSQQKPLKPGSAKSRLADTLNTIENKI